MGSTTTSRSGLWSTSQGAVAHEEGPMLTTSSRGSARVLTGDVPFGRPGPDQRCDAFQPGCNRPRKLPGDPGWRVHRRERREHVETPFLKEWWMRRASHKRAQLIPQV